MGLKYNYGRIQVSGPVMRSTGSDRGSFVRSVQSETQGIVRDLRNDVNRQCYGDGTGSLITISGANTGATFPVANATDAQLRHIEADMVVDIGSPAAPAAKGFAAVVDSVDRVNKTITLAGVVAVAANDVVFRTGSGGTGALQKEITGLKGQIAATGALWNIDPADHPRWASSVFTGAGAISEDMFIEASQTVNIESGEQIDLWVTTAAIQRATANLFTSLRRFNTPTELKGGYTGLDMSDVSQADTGSNTASMVYDKDMAEDGVAYGITTSKFQNYKMSDWEFMQDDGAILSRVPNADAYEATLFCYSEMATDARNAHTKISGITTA